MEEIRDRVAGLDVHRDQVVACVRVAEGRHVKTVKRSFPTTTAGVAELGAWLVDQGAGTAAMEATGVYWKPVVRHEALFDRAEVKGLRLRAVAAVR